MIFSHKKYFFIKLLSWFSLSFSIVASYQFLRYQKLDSKKSFLQRHALPPEIKKRFKFFLKSNNLDASFFKNSEKTIEQKLKHLGFERTTSGSNSLVMRCPKSLGNFVLKAPGRFHDVTRAVVDVPLENVTRAIGADRVGDYAAQKKLHYVKAIDEYLLRIPGASKELSDYHYLIVEPWLEVDAKKSFSDFSLEQFKEVIDIICAIDYSDTSADNIVIDKQGQIYFLDTSERDYLAKHKDLPSELYFSYSESKSDGTAQVWTESYEEAAGNVLSQSNDLVKRQAGEMINKQLEVIFHGLMPLDKEKLDEQKRAYLQEKLNHIAVDIQLRVTSFKKDPKLDKIDRNLKHLYDMVQLCPATT